MSEVKIPKLRFKADNNSNFDDWQYKKLGDLLKYEQPTKYLVSSVKYDNSYKTPVLTAGKTFIKGYTNETNGIFSKELPVIIFDDFTTAIQYVDFPFKAKSSAMKILKIQNKDSSIKLIYECMKIINFSADDHKRYWISQYQQLDIKLPQIEEQIKIANFLSAVDKKVEQLNIKKALFEKHKKGVMQQIFSQKIRFKTDDNSNFDDWKSKEMGEFGNPFNGLTGKTKIDFGGGKSYIQYKQIFDYSKIDIGNFGFVNIYADEKQQKTQYGDVFFTTSSETPNEVGYSSVLLDKIDELYLNSFCFGYRANSLDELKPEFLQYLFRSESFRKSTIKLAQGSTRYNISKNEMMKTIIKIPSFIEQTKIANFLSAIDKKISFLTQQIDFTSDFKKSLMQKMFV